MVMAKKIEAAPVKQGTTKMIFPVDTFWQITDKDPLYLAGKTYDIANNMVDRWLVRGAHLAKDISPDGKNYIGHSEPTAPTKVDEEVKPADSKPVEAKDKKAEDIEKPAATKPAASK